VINSGSAFAFVLAVGDSSTIANKIQTLENEEIVDEHNDLLDKHNNLVQILFFVLFFASAILLV